MTIRIKAFCMLTALGLLACQITVIAGKPTATDDRRPPTAEPATAEPTTTPTEHAIRNTDTAPVNFSLPADQRLALLPEYQDDLQALTDLSRYAIETFVDYDAHAYQGHLTLAYTNTETAALDRLYFRLFPNGGKAYGDGSLTVESVAVNGQPVQTALALDDSVLEVTLAAKLAPGQAARLDFEFAGRVPQDFGAGDDRGYGIYNFTDDVLTLTGWFPLLAVYDEEGWNLDEVSNMGDSVYSDMALFTVDISIPAEAVIAASGVEAGQREAGDVTHYRFVSGPAREFVLAFSPDYEVSSQVIDGVTVNSYYLPYHAAGGEQALEDAARAIEIYNQAFGAYPYSELDVLDTPLEYAAGVEFPGVILLAGDLYTPLDEYFSAVVAHEVAHQWWYHLIGNDIFDDPWLDEALASYSEFVFFEQVFGQEALQQIVAEYEGEYEQAVEWGLDDFVTASLDHYENDADAGDYGVVVYVKGALFFQALREEIGDEAFFAALRSYFTVRRYQIAAVQDLLDAFETTAGRSLDDLYQQWLYEAEK